MNQTKKYEFMSDYIDGNLTETEIESFFTENEEFKKEIEEVKSVLKEIKSIKPLKLSNSFDVKLNKAIKAYNRKQTFSYKVLNIFDNPVVATVGSVAAAVVLVVVTTIHFSTQSNEKIDISNGVDDFSYVDSDKEVGPYPEPELDIDMTGNNPEDND